jgi:hypothetical protein
MRLNASSFQLFACFTGCAFLFAGRYVSVAWARLGYALTSHLVRLVLRCASILVLHRLGSLNATSNVGSQGRTRRLILPRRAGQSPPLHYRVVGSPDRLGTIYICGSPNLRIKRWGVCIPRYLQRPSASPKGLRPLDSITRRREARVLVLFVAALLNQPTPELEAK